MFETNTDGSDGATERVRITQDGYLLVGKTSSSVGTAGSEVTPLYISATRASNAPLFVNRTSDAGHKPGDDDIPF